MPARRSPSPLRWEGLPKGHPLHALRWKGLPKGHPLHDRTRVSFNREVNEAIDALLLALELIHDVRGYYSDLSWHYRKKLPDWWTGPRGEQADDKQDAAYEVGKAIQAAIDAIVNSDLSDDS